MANPQIPQGFLNRLDVSVLWPAFSTLTVTPSFLGEAGVSLAFEGEATTFLPQMVGNVVSPEPWQMFTLTINLNRAQPLAQLYENQRLSNSAIGNGTVYTDSSLLGPYGLVNAGIRTINELQMDGKSSGYVVVIRGTYQINNSLWS